MNFILGLPRGQDHMFLTGVLSFTGSGNYQSSPYHVSSTVINVLWLSFISINMRQYYPSLQIKRQRLAE